MSQSINDDHYLIRASNGLIKKLYEPLIKKSILPVVFGTRDFVYACDDSELDNRTVTGPDRITRVFISSLKSKYCYAICRDKCESEVDASTYTRLLFSIKSFEDKIDILNKRICKQCYAKGIDCYSCYGSGIIWNI